MSEIKLLGDLEIQNIEKKIRGKFNKDLLLNSYFEHTELFSPAANKFLKEGKYCGEVFNSKKYNIFWGQERERCIYGYENPKTKVWIPGKYYFFLNYKQMKIVPEEEKGKKSAKRILAFPKFWAIHYHYMIDWLTAKENGLNMIVLKPRDTGFSELLSSNGVHDYTFQKEDPVFYFVAHERFLNKDGVLTKAWDQMNFLNESTERAFKHLRQYKDQDLYKRASYMDPETRNERRTGGEIQGAVIDHPRKVRGARGTVYWEECLGKDTKVFMFDKTFKNVQDIVVGDLVMGVDSRPKKVIQTCNGVDEMYRIEQQKGIHYTVNSQHKLFLQQKCNSNTVWDDGDKLITPVDFLKIKSKGRKQCTYGIKSSGLDYESQKLPFEPYWFGVWLGDGDSKKASLIVNIVADPEIANYLYDYSLRLGVGCKTREVNTCDKCKTFDYYNPELKHKNLSTRLLKRLLQNKDKHIPKEYLYSSMEDRLQLLAGIIDTDGSLKKGTSSYSFSYEITMVREELIDQIILLARSCGFYCKKGVRKNSLKGYSKNPDTHYYRVMIRGDIKRIPVKVKRKKVPEDYNPTSNPLNTRINVVPIGQGEYFGFTLEGKEEKDHLFLLEDFTITHNCGSFPNVKDAWMTAHALTVQGGVSFAQQTGFGTGGENGPGIDGMEEIFTNPHLFHCLEFDNCWEESLVDKPHGFFFPVWANMTKFMDKWGNTNHREAKAFHDKEREKLQKSSNALMDKYIAEYPYTPSEALSRLSSNPFPINELRRQLQKVDSSPDIQGILKVGEWEIADGEVKFVLNPKLDPVNKYPHKTDAVLEGAFTMFEAPLRDVHGKVPDNLYYIVADCFYVDTEQATDWNSLGSYYVYKKVNTLFPTEDDILVGWYAGRPPRAKDFHRRVFMAARAYNAIVQTEIKGGGNELLNYAKEHSMLQYCGERPTVFNQDKEFKKVSGRQFFVRIEDSNKPELLQKLSDWLRKERGSKIENDKAQYVLNLERIYDRALLEELIKFNYTGNFDRISCLLVLMCIIQEAELQAITALTQQNRDHVFKRTLFSDNESSREFQLSHAEMTAGEKATYHRENPTDMIF